jgi:hypothetical protein
MVENKLDEGVDSKPPAVAVTASPTRAVPASISADLLAEAEAFLLLLDEWRRTNKAPTKSGWQKFYATAPEFSHASGLADRLGVHADTGYTVVNPLPVYFTPGLARYAENLLRAGGRGGMHTPPDTAVPPPSHQAEPPPQPLPTAGTDVLPTSRPLGTKPTRPPSTHHASVTSAGVHDRRPSVSFNPHVIEVEEGEEGYDVTLEHGDGYLGEDREGNGDVEYRYVGHTPPEDDIIGDEDDPVQFTFRAATQKFVGFITLGNKGVFSRFRFDPCLPPSLQTLVMCYLTGGQDVRALGDAKLLQSWRASILLHNHKYAKELLASLPEGKWSTWRHFYPHITHPATITIDIIESCLHNAVIKLAEICGPNPISVDLQYMLADGGVRSWYERMLRNLETYAPHADITTLAESAATFTLSWLDQTFTTWFLDTERALMAALSRSPPRHSRTNEAWTANCVGGGTVHMSGYFYRLRRPALRIQHSAGPHSP